MKRLLVFLFLVGCAHGKMGAVEQPLDAGSVPAGATIYVEPVSAKEAVFSGDKSAKEDKVNGEIAEIEQTFHQNIIDQLHKKGFKAVVAQGTPKSGIVLSGAVRKFEHGSAAARILVGMGAGSSNMFTNFQLTDKATGRVLSKFEVIATSGGNGGLQAAGGYIHAHITDGAAKVAEYIAQSNSNVKK